MPPPERVIEGNVPEQVRINGRAFPRGLQRASHTPHKPSPKSKERPPKGRVPKGKVGELGKGQLKAARIVLAPKSNIVGNARLCRPNPERSQFHVLTVEP
jgi:hypothetical protein